MSEWINEWIKEYKWIKEQTNEWMNEILPFSAPVYASLPFLSYPP